MKLKNKIIIGTSISAAVVATGIALAVGLSSNGSNGQNVKGILYNTVRQELKETVPTEPEKPVPPPKKEPETKPEIIEPEPEKQKEEIPPPSLVPEVEDEVPPTTKPIEETPPTLEPTPYIPEPEPEIKEKVTKPNVAEDPIEPFQDTEIEEVESTEINELGGIKIKYRQKKQPKRLEWQSDKDAGIQNPTGYLSELVPDVIGLTWTEQLRQKSVERVRSGFKYQITTNQQGYFKDVDGNDLESLVAQNKAWWDNVFSRWKLLFDNGDKVFEFLTEEGQRKYPEIKNLPQAQKYPKLLAYIDINKFKILTPDAEEQIKKGFIIDDRNLYVDENGRLASNTYDPLPGHNKVTSRLKYDNKNRRLLGFETEFNRTAYGVQNGEYYGWKKHYATSEYKQYGFDEKHGISFLKYKRDNPEQGQLNEAIILEADLSNEAGYNGIKKLIEDLKKDNQRIDGFRFKNIGKKDANQRFIDIAKALPNKIGMLELFFETTNTSSLIALENKKIQELSLYTSINPLLPEWSINPWAVKGVSWVNTNDYNVSFEYAPGVRKFSRIVFDALAFEESDILKDKTTIDDKMERINWGLRMAYFTRNNEPFFQGSWGGGLKPDHNEGGNSYPLGLDLTRTKLKSMRGMFFADAKKVSNKLRKLKRLKLYNDKSIFEIPAEELNEAQFKDIMIIEGPQMPKTKISFSNGSQTKEVHVTGNSIKSEGIDNLRVLLNWSEDNFNASTKVWVDQGATNLYNQLSNYGFNVEYKTADIDLKVT